MDGRDKQLDAHGVRMLRTTTTESTAERLRGIALFTG